MQINLDRHNAGLKYNYCLRFDPPNFSLPSTFKQMLNNAHFLRDCIEITKEKSVENCSWTSCTEKGMTFMKRMDFIWFFAIINVVAP